ncbi:hypothetical protein GCM10023149_41690 [Mucilaginibacter gynuensis]|uniref:DUF5672 domain-containing protein n=1 Tax=Mucilaginibacter gynuensis TaxID=1302236 RepID=A0ABP8H4S5_9SPHI
MAGKEAVIIIPFYKTTLTAYENIALDRCFKTLSRHNIIAIKPRSLTMPAETGQYTFTGVVSFDDDFFVNIQGYNRLMMSEVFYGAFLDYKYILIHQLDVFVFKDELQEWCSQNWDYIGAPWIRSYIYPDFVKKLKCQLLIYYHKRVNTQVNGVPIDEQFYYQVGNGGFSLRNTHKFYDLCQKLQPQIALYNSHTEHQYNEDAFWSLEVNRKKKRLKIPGYKRALKFSIEFQPERAMDINNNVLPFGCHAWDLYIDFWKPIIEQYGYKL